jgi:uncharacterized protein YjcR
MAEAMHQADGPRADDDTPAISRQVARAQRRQARTLYHRGWQLTQIAAELGVKYGTLAAWKSREGWDEDAPIAVVEDRLEARIALLLDKEPFTEGDMKRVDFMMRQMERAARIRKFDKTGREGDLNPKIAKRNDEEAKAKRADKRKNFLSPEQWQALLDDFHARNFAYQEHWWDHRDERTRKILKSRQIGATWYFAREALAKIAQDMLAGAQPRNQIFLSASQRQANKFRREIVGWVKRVTGVELKGNPIMLDLTGLTEDGPALDSVGLYPLSTNSNTAQGESGDFYFDEFFWVHGFAQLRKVAAAMATHTIYKRTYFSTLDQDPRGLCVLVGRGMEQGPPSRAAAALRYLEAEPARRGHDARWKLAADRHPRRCHRRGRGRADRPRGTAAGIERRGIQQPL